MIKTDSSYNGVSMSGGDVIAIFNCMVWAAYALGQASSGLTFFAAAKGLFSNVGCSLNIGILECIIYC